MAPVEPRPGIGISIFLAVIILILLVAVPLQMHWGIWGLALTELMLLAAALVPPLIFKWDLKSVFPFRRPTWRQLLGVLVLFGGSYLAVTASSLVIFYFFPRAFTEVTNSFLDLYRSVPLPVTLFIVSLMPAVCEEFLHRGLILFNFRRVGKWGAVFFLGLIFGLFHLDPFRFLGTMILGILLTYTMVETKNLWLPILFHLLNNAISILSSLGAEPSPEVSEVSLATVGAALVAAAVAPLLFLWAGRLFKSKEDRQSHSGKLKLVALIVSLALFLGGIALTTSALLGLAFETSFTAQGDALSEPRVEEFSIETSGDYAYNLKIQGSGVITTLVISRDSGEEIYNMSCGAMYSNGFLHLEAGAYRATFSYDLEDAESASVRVKLRIRRNR